VVTQPSTNIAQNAATHPGLLRPFVERTFESSLAKVHKITKKVGQNRSAPLGSSNFTGKRLSLLVSIHMAFVEGMLIKQMRMFLCVAVWEALSFSTSNVAIFSLRLYETDNFRLKISGNKM